MSEVFSIKETTGQVSGLCYCGHSGAAHGSNGKICAACVCKNFEEVFDPKKPILSHVPVIKPVVRMKGV